MFRRILLGLAIVAVVAAGCSITQGPTPTPLPIPTVTPLALATVVPSPSVIRPVLSPSPTPPPPIVYVVKYGDTLIDLAQRYQTTVEAIMAANNLADPHMIKMGQELFIPRPTPTPTGR